MSQLIISQSYLIEKSVITNNTDFKYLTPVIEWVQDLKIRPLLGTNLFNEIITQTTPPTSLTAANQTLVDDYLLKTMLFYIMSDAVVTLRYKFTNVGILVRSTENAQPMSEAETAKLQDYYKNKAEEYGQLMINYIKGNPSLYPSYFTNTGQGTVLPNPDAMDCGIFLPPSKSIFPTNEEIREIGSGYSGNSING